MARFASLLMVLAVVLCASDVRAQGSSSGSSTASSSDYRLELIPHAGYAWTFSRDAFYGTFAGEVDFEDSAYWGIAADLNMRSGKQARLLYRRQDTELVFRRFGGGSQKSDVAIEYWHVGALGGVPRGNMMPYGLLTLGGTRIAPKEINDDTWKFSMIFGLGVKYYGERFGLMLQGSFPFTVIDGGGTITVGSGGVYTTVGGYGIGQMDLTGGLILRI